MAQVSGFFTAQQRPDGSYDRSYTAEQFAYYFSKFIGNGIYATPVTQLQVSQSNAIDMSVNVNIGDAYINGWWFKNTNIVNLPIAAANGVNGRIDLIVVRWSKLDRDIRLAVVQGIAAPVPQIPELTRNNDVYELCLARVDVGATDTTVTNSMITDKRYDSSVCGMVKGVVDQIDTTNLFQQFQAVFDEWYDGLVKYANNAEETFDNLIAKAGRDLTTMLENSEIELDNQLNDNQNVFEVWFESIKNKLSGDIATNLQKQIDEINEELPKYTDEDWHAGAFYEKHTYIKHNGFLWIALEDTVNEEPTDDSQSWLKLAAAILTPTTTETNFTKKGEAAVDATALNPDIKDSLASQISNKFDGAFYDSGNLHFTSNGQDILNVDMGVSRSSLIFSFQSNVMHNSRNSYDLSQMFEVNGAAILKVPLTDVKIVKSKDPLKELYDYNRVKMEDWVNNVVSSLEYTNKRNSHVNVRNARQITELGATTVLVKEWEGDIKANIRAFRQNVQAEYTIQVYNEYKNVSKNKYTLYTQADIDKLYLPAECVTISDYNAPRGYHFSRGVINVYELYNYDYVVNMNCMFSNSNMIRGNAIFGQNVQVAGYAYAHSSINGNVIIPNIDTIYFANAFENCVSLKGELIVDDNSTNWYMRNMFCNCYQLKGNFFVPDRVQNSIFNVPEDVGISLLPNYLGGAYVNCQNMSGILKFPNHIGKWNVQNTENCHALEQMSQYNQIYYNSDYDNRRINVQAFANWRGVADVIYHNCKNATGIEMPNTDNLIGIMHAFNTVYNSEVLKDRSLWYKGNAPIVFPCENSILDMGFYNQSLMVGMPNIDNVKSGHNAFYMCTNLSGDLVVDSKCLEYGYMMFFGCNNISNVYINNSVLVNATNMFYNGNNIEEVTVSSSADNLKAIDMFNGCSNISNINIYAIGNNANYYRAFNYSPNVNRVNIYCNKNYTGSVTGFLQYAFNSGITNMSADVYLYENSSYEYYFNYQRSYVNNMGFGQMQYYMADNYYYNATRNIRMNMHYIK